MSPASALASIPVGVLVERRKAISPWADWVWRPSAVLPGHPDTVPWTRVSGDEACAIYYAGAAEVALHAAETANYVSNLTAETPMLWVILQPTEAEPAYDVVTVTADPSEGEGFTQAGPYLVEAVAMPEAVRDMIEGFVATHHVERPFYKRKRDRADPEALGRRSRVEGDGTT